MPLTVSNSLLRKELELDFFAEVKARMESSAWRKISTVVNSDERTREYGWLGSPPAVREFGAERRPAGIGEHTYLITNKKWEASIEVDNDDLKHYNRGGQVSVRIAQLGHRFANHPSLYLFNDMLTAAETANCYDGTAFYGTAHPYEGGTQSNDITVAVNNSAKLTLDEAEDTFNAAWVQLMSFRDDVGELANDNPTAFVLACAHTHVPVFRKLFSTQTIGLGLEDNLVGGMDVTVYGTPNIGATKVHVFNAGDVVKPFVFQQVSEVEFGDDGGNFMTDFTVFGAKANYNFGYGDYRKACLVTLT